jgi:hypothetical protein
VTNLLVFAAPLTAGLVLVLVGQWRGWAPSLPVAVGTGVVLRVAVLLLAWRFNVHPYDFSVDFPTAADNVLHGRDPVLTAREGGWHFLPLSAYVLAGQLRLGQVLGIGWAVIGRLVPIFADLALIPLVGKLARGRSPALRAFQWAANPLAIMVCAVHGQLEPIALAFGVGALVVARSAYARRAVAAGILVGLAITVNSWPALLVPGVLLALPGTRRRLTALLWAGAVPLVFFVTQPLVLGHAPSGELIAVARALAKTRPVVGDWGWTAIAEGGTQTVDPALGTIGTGVLLAGLALAVWWWRRADALTLTAVILLAFLICTHRLGAQYLLWPLPYLLARPARGTWPAFTAACMWAAIGYLWLGTTATYDVWWMRHEVWALLSLAVIPLLVWALPWSRRTAAPPVERSGRAEPAVACST